MKLRQWKKSDIDKLMKSNGFHLDRYNGSHKIFVDESGKHISIPRSINPVIIQRLIKENNLKTDD